MISKNVVKKRNKLLSIQRLIDDGVLIEFDDGSVYLNTNVWKRIEEE